MSVGLWPERPLLQLPNAPIYIVDVHNTDIAVQKILSSSVTDNKDNQMVCGLDAEWPINYVSGGSQCPAATLQVCVRCNEQNTDSDKPTYSYDTYVFQLSVIGLPPSLRRLIMAKKLLKVGVSVTGDVSKVARDHDLPVDQMHVCELSNMANQVLNCTESWSLDALCRRMLKHRLEKCSVRTSDWAKHPLSKEQLDYAALDAFASLRVYEELQKKLLKNDRLK